MKYCKKCVQPDTRPGITFDSEGVCHACGYAEKKDQIDWEARERELKDLVEWAKRNRSKFMSPDGNGYDCIVGVSGGKDSTFQALYARDVLGLHCLLVNYSPSDITEIGKHNMDNLRKQGFDVLKFQVNPKVEKQLAKNFFFKHGNIYKAAEYVLYATVIRAALAYKIPLVILGENPAIYQGDEVNIIGDGGNALKVIDHNTTAGGRARDLVGDGVSSEDVVSYQWPSKDEIEQAGVKAIFLGYYIKDWSSYNNAQFSIAHGMKVRTDDLHDLGRTKNYQALDCNAVIVNQMLKYLKFGFGNATDEVNWDIREGKITREEGVKRVHEYDGKCGPQFIKEFCDLIDISPAEFWKVAESYRNKDIFEKVGGEWRLKEPLK